MAAALLSTKLYTPRLRPEHVARPRLTAMLHGVSTAALTLLSAPAGFGKTTLLAGWLAEQPHPWGWLSLDGGDNDPSRFWRYTVTALRQALPGVGGPALAALAAPSAVPDPVQVALDHLLNELAEAPAPLVLVLDDYHLITERSVHTSLLYAVEHLPPSVHLVLATRADPPLPLARLRSRGQLLELRARELRFTTGEAAEFLAQTLASLPAPADIAALVQRTEGWAAGLQMASLALRSRPPEQAAKLIGAFTGSHHFVLDYLSEEAFDQQPPVVQRFLLHTAVLERLSAPLCAAVMDEEAAGAQAMLEHLQRANLFLVPLDDVRTWFRYHHLFADLLRARLQQADPALPAALRRRAADWCEAHDLPGEAITYALAADDTARAKKIIHRHWRSLAHRGEIDTVIRWYEALPVEARAGDAYTAVGYVWALFLKSRLSEMAGWLDIAEAALARLDEDGSTPPNDAGGPDNADYATLRTQLACLRSFAARQRGDFTAAVAYAEQALALCESETGGVPLLRGIALYMLGHAHREQGAMTEAAAALHEALPLLQAGGNIVAITHTTYHLALAEAAYGRLAAGLEMCRSALHHAEAHGYPDQPALGPLHAALADLLCRRNELPAAVEAVRRSRELADVGGAVYAKAVAALATARLHQAQGELSQAVAALDEASATLAGAEMAQVHGELAALRARLQIASGDLRAAAVWMRETEQQGPAHPLVAEYTELTVVRLLLAQGRAPEALPRLQTELAAAQTAGRTATEIEVYALQALALQSAGRRAAALDALAQALALAAPQNYGRLFLNEGPPMLALLQAAARDGHPYAARLLEQAGAVPGEPAPAVLPLVEPLTDREVEVLGLVAAGHGNREIADRLVLSVGTVKAHIHNIYGKLGVESRIQAVARSRELGLL